MPPEFWAAWEGFAGKVLTGDGGQIGADGGSGAISSLEVSEGVQSSRADLGRVA